MFALAHTPLLRSLLEAHPNALDLTECRNVRLAHSIQARIERDKPGSRDVFARMWALPFEGSVAASQIQVTSGVQHGLALLFAGLAEDGITVAIPSDISPNYLQLAKACRVPFTTYEALAALDILQFEGADCILLPNPMLPRGGGLDDSEVKQLQAWLGMRPARRVLLDASEDLWMPLSPDTRGLFASGQVIVLNSLHRGWGCPGLAGTVMLPLGDVARWEPVFSAVELDAFALGAAVSVLKTSNGARLGQAFEFQLRNELLLQLLTDKGIALVPRKLGVSSGTCILQVVGSPEELALKGIVGIPLSVFGSRISNVTLVSGLGLPFADVAEHFGKTQQAKAPGTT